MIIGITGSIGSGKTTVAKLFSKHLYNRIDADEIGHQILKKNSFVYKKIIKNFGDGILDRNKNIDRIKLGDVVFENNKKMEILNSITHPIIINEIKNQIKKQSVNKIRIVVDAPLLLETQTKNLVDKIIVVRSDKKNILKRLNKKYSKEKIEKILNAQMPLNQKLEYADFVVDNNKDLRYLEKQIKKIIKELEI